MEKEIEYQLYFGIKDQQTHKAETDSADNVRMVADYFKKRNIGFSISKFTGGFLHEDGTYLTEDTGVITLIGNQGLDIEAFAKGLGMYLNQQCSLITKKEVIREFR